MFVKEWKGPYERLIFCRDQAKTRSTFLAYATTWQWVKRRSRQDYGHCRNQDQRCRFFSSWQTKTKKFKIECHHGFWCWPYKPCTQQWHNPFFDQQVPLHWNKARCCVKVNLPTKSHQGVESCCYDNPRRCFKCVVLHLRQGDNTNLQLSSSRAMMNRGRTWISSKKLPHPCNNSVLQTLYWDRLFDDWPFARVTLSLAGMVRQLECVVVGTALELCLQHRKPAEALSKASGLDHSLVWMRFFSVRVVTNFSKFSVTSNVFLEIYLTNHYLTEITSLGTIPTMSFQNIETRNIQIIQKW